MSLASWIILLPLIASRQLPTDDGARQPAASPEAQAAAERAKLGALVEAQREPAIERRARIREELKQAELPRWAGEFTNSRGKVTFCVAPRAGMTVCSSMHVVGSDRWNHGSIVASGERWIDVELLLPHEAVTRAEDGGRVPCTSKRFHLVTWRDRDFLVPERELLPLCNVFNSRTDATYLEVSLDKFASRSNGRAIDVDSPAYHAPPELPAEFRKYVLDHVVRGHITALDAPVQNGTYGGSEPRLEITVTADVGLKDGLQLGMWLFRKGSSPFAHGSITEIGEATCRAVFRMIDPGAKKQTTAAVGDGVMTRVDAEVEDSAAVKPTADPLAELELRAKAEEPAADARQERISVELQQSGLPRWAGRFFRQGYATFSAAPGAGFVASTSHHVPGSSRWNHGRIVASGERWFDVELVLPHEALAAYALGSRIPATAKRFHLVTWRDEDFLVPEHRMLEVCNAYNALPVRAVGSAGKLDIPCRENEPPPDADSRELHVPPDVPAEYRKYLLDHVVTGKVTALAEAVRRGSFSSGRARYETIVTVDVGLRDGLLPGMLLYFLDRDGYGSGEILDAEEATCRVAFRHDILPGFGIKGDRELRVGEVVATRVEGVKRAR
jgi:hypothetical protein